jgi:tetratricopeptide (TPR) repeat protein
MGEENGLVSRWHELRRHPAAQAAAVYIAASWALIQLADIFFPSLDIVRRLGIALVVGFPIVVGGAWWLASRQPAAAASDTETTETQATAAAGARRRRRRFAYTAAIGLLAVGGIFWWIRPNILGAVAPDAQVIAVLPFNTSGPGVELLGEGMVDLISPNLDAVGGIRTVDSRTVLHRWRQRSAEGGLDFAGSLAVGRDVNAGAVLLGSVVSAGPTVRLTAELYSVKGDELARARAEGPADSVLALVDSLGIKVLREIWLAREPVPNLRVSGITTGNVDAIRAYLRGQQYYRRSQWDSALVAFQGAVDADSAFALAHYRLGLTYGWSLKHGGFGSRDARRHAELALRYADRLPPRGRMLVVSHHLFEQGDIAAHDTMVQYVKRYGGDAEGWYMLGDIRYHARTLLALDLDELFEPFDRVLELDPSLAPALIHPLELSLTYDDSARYNRYLTNLRGLVEFSEVERFELAKSFWDRPDSLLAWLPQLMGGSLGGAALFATYESKSISPNAVLAMFEAGVQQTAQTEHDSIRSLQAGGLMLASVGRLAESRALFDTLWAIAPNDEAAFFSLLPVIVGIADSTFAKRPASDELRADAVRAQPGAGGGGPAPRESRSRLRLSLQHAGLRAAPSRWPGLG